LPEFSPTDVVAGNIDAATLYRPLFKKSNGVAVVKTVTARNSKLPLKTGEVILTDAKVGKQPWLFADLKGSNGRDPCYRCSFDA